MGISRAKSAPLTYGVSGGTFQGILEADRDTAYGHSDALQTQDELLGTAFAALFGGTGYGQVCNTALTVAGGEVTAPTGLTYQVGGVIYQLTAGVSQAYTAGILNYVFMPEFISETGLLPRVSASATPTAGDVLIGTVDDSGSLGTVAMNPTGKLWVRKGAVLTLTTSGTPDAENTKAHTLGRTPLGYIVLSQDKAASIYKGTTAWDATNIYLKATVASVALRILAIG